jgi:hypothetical protein
MELMKIAGGLAVIAILVVVFGMGGSPRGGGATGASGPADRSFVSEDTSARFVPVATE